MYTTYLNKSKEITFEVAKERQAYLVLLEGKVKINSIVLNMRDALEITEENIKIQANENAHIAVIEMAKY
jgi:redox-sensitive bicupin YhaK (pirin superfamily)